MAINRRRVRQLLDNFDFKTLFIEQLGWSSAYQLPPEPVGEIGYMSRRIAELSGVSIFEVFPATAASALPDSATRARIHSQIEAKAYNNALIFLDHDDHNKRSQCVLYWVKREENKKRPRQHPYFKGQPGDLMMAKLDRMAIDIDELDEQGGYSLVLAMGKVSDALDIETVTKKFFSAFSQLRLDFIKWIDGINSDADRGWYASVLLNRLMFIYFLQKKAFISGDTAYLETKLKESGQRGADLFYSEFLDALFFEGFAKPEGDRSPKARELLGGDIPYLNGGLFIRHKLELEHSAIRIPDAAFSEVLALFGRYSWYLDDAPGAKDNEINPDVLGYIFEKYINQKAFGAYYTRAEITKYLCQRSIHPVILDQVNQHSNRQFSDLPDLLMKLDADLCRILLDQVLPKLSILDPACGSGAFLVAAMKNLLQIYGAVFGRIKVLNDNNLSNSLAKLVRQHPKLDYYIRKRIISDNLYGVDIMDEAAEIAKLRLFLALVGAAQTANQLEPLPNIDFNIMAGNSLIGLLSVDEGRFDAQRQQDFLQHENVKNYRRALAEKNRAIETYRAFRGRHGDLQDLRDSIDAMKAAHQEPLNAILLDDFQALKIQYEGARLKGRPVKRPLRADDMADLKPFHWGYEFDEILEQRGGFDVIITNPPWEIFKPQDEEFFADYDDSIRQKRANRVEKRRRKAQLLEDPDIREAYLDYQSGYRHVSAWYRAAKQYENQISRVNGRKQGTDINLYKLFTEQCFNLLREGGACGIVIPSGIYSDLGTKQLRQMLFEKTRLSGLFGFENRQAIFEGVHRSFKFIVLSFDKGGQTQSFPAAFMRHHVEELESFPDNTVDIAIDLVRRSSPSSLSVTEFKSDLDVQITEKLLAFPLLGESLPGKWNVKLKTEFHMTNDSDLFHDSPGVGRLPLYEGKMIWQFEHGYAEPRYWIDEAAGRKRVLGKKGKDTGQKLGYQKFRLAHRRMARSTDTRALIAAILPSNSFASDNIHVVIEPHNLCVVLAISALWNSYVCDWAIGLKINSVINMFYLQQLPIPRLMPGDRYFDQIVSRAARLICTAPEFDDLAAEVGLGDHRAGVKDPGERAKLRAELDGMVARIYGLSEAEFAHILSTFPLVDDGVKAAALAAFVDLGE